MKIKIKLFDFDKQCIFCKYKYDKGACITAALHDDWKCPSVSNILHGKVFKLPVIKQIYDYISDKQMEKDLKAWEEQYISENETEDMLFVWGVLSGDDLSSTTANLYSINDLDLIYYKNEHKYSLGVETNYMFKENGHYGYMKSLLDEFTKWMNENDYDTNRELSLWKVFTDGIIINTKFESIEEAYTTFKMMVNGYCSLQKENTYEEKTN